MGIGNDVKLLNLLESQASAFGTTIANGTMIFSIVSDNPNSQLIDLEPYNLFIAPGEFLTISAYSSNSATVGCAVNWVED